MPLTEKPPGRGPLFGGRAQIIIGAGLVQQMREWQAKKRLSATSQDSDEDGDQQDSAG